MHRTWRWLTENEADYSGRFVLQVVVRLVILLAVFNVLYLVIQPLDRHGLTLYNHVFPGRLRMVWQTTTVATPLKLVTNEVRLSRLVADHVISRPKAPDEYRVVVLGSSEVWGDLNRPQDTMPVVLDSMGIKTPDGRAVRSYNLAYVFADGYKDLLILDEVLRTTDKPDLILFTVNSYTFSPCCGLHWLVTNNPEPAVRLKKAFNLTVELDSIQEENWLKRHNFVAERRDIAAWLMNQAYGLAWAETGLDYPLPQRIPVQIKAQGFIAGWKNQRPGLLDAVTALAAKHQIPLLLASVPSNYSSDFSGWLEDQARELKTPLLDCSALLWPYNFTNGALHLDADGHQRFAEQVSTWLQAWWSDPTLKGQFVSKCPAWNAEKK